MYVYIENRAVLQVFSFIKAGAARVADPLVIRACVSFSLLMMLRDKCLRGLERENITM